VTRSAIVESTARHQSVHRCVTLIVESIPFGAIREGGITKVRFPFLFVP
jgi:hypothetical protein